MPSTLSSSPTPEQIQEQEYATLGAYHWGLTLRDYGWMKHFVNYTTVVSTLQAYLPQSASILDVGCGDGYCTDLLTRSFRQVIGIDSSERALAFARERVPTSSFQCNDARSISLPSHSIDGIACVETLEHMPPAVARAVVSEIHRLLRPKGIFVATVPSDRFPLNPKHYNHYNESSLRTLLAPFPVVYIEGSCRTPTHLFDICYRLSSNKHWYIPFAQRALHELYDFCYSRCSPTQGTSLLAMCKM